MGILILVALFLLGSIAWRVFALGVRVGFYLAFGLIALIFLGALAAGLGPGP